MALPAALLEKLSSHVRLATEPAERTLALDWPELDAALPSGGLPAGVTELSSEGALGTSLVAIAAVRAAQQKDPRAWCAWVEVGDPLHAPGLAQAGIDLARLLVVKAPAQAAAKVSVRVATSGAFEVIVIDAFAMVRDRDRRALAEDVIVRKLALAAETHGARILLLSDARAHRAVPWPVAMRVELERSPDALWVRVARERHGRLRLEKARVPRATRPALAG